MEGRKKEEKKKACRSICKLYQSNDHVNILPGALPRVLKENIPQGTSTHLDQNR
jgi:hypothetical protein